MKTVVLVLRSGGDFTFKDVELIARHIHGKWISAEKPRIICLFDKVQQSTDLGNILFLPLPNNHPGTWSRLALYSPEMEQYRPFLYIDLDTIIVKSIENIFDLVKDQSQYITLEDFSQKGQLATALVWFPANSKKIENVWKNQDKAAIGTFRMDYYLRRVITADKFWQQLSNTIYDFKPLEKKILLDPCPVDANIVCLHGKPRIWDAASRVQWVDQYINFKEFNQVRQMSKVSVIIPYKVNRGWLNEAIKSVPKDVQLLVSQGEGNWPVNFNKVLKQTTGDYIKFLHEDDMLTERSIENAVNAIDKQKVDFIHGNAYEISINSENPQMEYIPSVKIPTVESLLQKNTIHSATLMYKREIFDKIGSFDESLWTQEEFEFNLRCLKAGFKIGYCNSFLAYYRRHPQQKVRTVPIMEIKEEKKMVRAKYI